MPRYTYSFVIRGNVTVESRDSERFTESWAETTLECLSMPITDPLHEPGVEDFTISGVTLILEETQEDNE